MALLVADLDVVAGLHIAEARSRVNVRREHELLALGILDGQGLRALVDGHDLARHMVRQGEPARLLRGGGGGAGLTGGFDEAGAGPKEKGQTADC